MSDHIDGPRTTADPSVDLSDLFAFTSPENPARTVFIACAFPFAGGTALFSNAVKYSFVVRPVRITGTGAAAGFRAQDPELRFTFEFEVLKRDAGGKRNPQTGVCKLPDGRSVPVVVGAERGSATPDGSVRVFAGLRSDPFFIGWRPDRKLTSVPNLLQESNCLSVVIEFDTASILRPGGHTLFGLIAETTPRDPEPYLQTVPRFDWVGRPEQTNFRLNINPDLPDIRDLWNQETPFAISAATLPVYRERLTRSFQLWASWNDKPEWDPVALAANVNVFLEDYLLFDVGKPITDISHLEIERSTIDGRAYATGGGRTVNANVIDILLTWLIKHDRGAFMKSATQATQPGAPTFPYVRPPNRLPLKISRSVEVAAAPEAVWAVIGEFGGLWMPRVATIETSGTGIGQVRRVDTVDGRVILERLTALDNQTRTLKYELLGGLPAADYEATMQVQPKGSGSVVSWDVTYRPEGVADVVTRTLITNLQRVNLDHLKTLFGPAP